MAAYTKTTWANSPSTSSPLSAANLQHIEDFVQELSDDKYTGNGGQPPAPKPTTGTPSSGADGPGQMYTGSTSNAAIYGAGAVSKSTGVWFGWFTTWTTATGVITATKTGAAYGGGNTALFTVSASETCNWFAVRVA